MIGYSFHCSRCKISHAGVCPPAVVPLTPYVGHMITEMPLIGSKWFVDWKEILQDWKELTGKVEVVRYVLDLFGDGAQVVVRGVLGTVEHHVSIDAFTDQGVVARLLPDVHLWRFIRLVT